MIFFSLNDRAGGMPRVQRAFCNVQKQVKLNQVEGRMSRLKKRCIERGSRKMGSFGGSWHGLPTWAAGPRAYAGM